MALNFPNSPTNGQIYTDGASGNRWSWDSANTCWVSTSTFTQTITVSSTQPGSPVDGQLWWNKDYGRLMVYYNDGTSSQWVDATPNDFNAVFAYNTANASFGKANTALQNTSGTFAGNLSVTGTLGVGTSSPLGIFSSISDNSYVHTQATVYNTAYFGPRPANDGFCSIYNSWSSTANADNMWIQDYSSSSYTISQKVSGTTSTRMTIDNTGNVNLTKANVTSLVVSNQDYVTGHPLSFKDCLTWIDLDYSYPYATTSDATQQYVVRDLAPRGLSWHLRAGAFGALQNSHITTSAPGTSKRVFKTGTTSDSGIIASNQLRADRHFNTQNWTAAVWLWHPTTTIKSNETIMGQVSGVNGNYQIIRAYPTNWNFYNTGIQGSTGSYTNTGGFNTATWTFFAFVSYNGTTMRVYKYNSTYPTGTYDDYTFTQNWVWTGTADNMALTLGGSSWGSNNGEPWGVGSDITGNGYFGPFMWYNSALANSELTSLFNYYKNAFTN